MKRSIIIIIFVLISLTLLAEDIVMPIIIDYTGDDNVGGRLVYELKEGIKKSESMSLSLIDELGIRISIITINSDRNNPGNKTIYSIAWLWNTPGKPFPYYLTSTVGFCGSQRVSETAQGLVADTYEQSEKMLKLLINMIQELNKNNE